MLLLSMIFFDRDIDGTHITVFNPNATYINTFDVVVTASSEINKRVEHFSDITNKEPSQKMLLTDDETKFIDEIIDIYNLILLNFAFALEASRELVNTYLPVNRVREWKHKLISKPAYLASPTYKQLYVFLLTIQQNVFRFIAMMHELLLAYGITDDMKQKYDAELLQLANGTHLVNKTGLIDKILTKDQSLRGGGNLKTALQKAKDISIKAQNLVDLMHVNPQLKMLQTVNPAKLVDLAFDIVPTDISADPQVVTMYDPTYYEKLAANDISFSGDSELTLLHDPIDTIIKQIATSTALHTKDRDIVDKLHSDLYLRIYQIDKIFKFSFSSLQLSDLQLSYVQNDQLDAKYSAVVAHKQNLATIKSLYQTQEFVLFMTNLCSFKKTHGTTEFQKLHVSNPDSILSEAKFNSVLGILSDITNIKREISIEIRTQLLNKVRGRLISQPAADQIKRSFDGAFSYLDDNSKYMKYSSFLGNLQTFEDQTKNFVAGLNLLPAQFHSIDMNSFRTQIARLVDHYKAVKETATEQTSAANPQLVVDLQSYTKNNPKVVQNIMRLLATYKLDPCDKMLDQIERTTDAAIKDYDEAVASHNLSRVLTNYDDKLAEIVADFENIADKLKYIEESLDIEEIIKTIRESLQQTTGGGNIRDLVEINKQIVKNDTDIIELIKKTANLAKVSENIKMYNIDKMYDNYKKQTEKLQTFCQIVIAMCKNHPPVQDGIQLVQLEALQKKLVNIRTIDQKSLGFFEILTNFVNRVLTLCRELKQSDPTNRVNTIMLDKTKKSFAMLFVTEFIMS